MIEPNFSGVVPKLERPEAIRTKQGIRTLAVYMKFMCRKHSLRSVHPFSFDDMFQEAYAFLLEHVDEWNPELGQGFDTWATEMLRFGWLKAVKRMHWAGYRVMSSDQHYQIEGRRITRFGEDEFGRSEMDAVKEPSDAFDTLADDDHMESLLSQLEDRDRKIIEMLMGGYTGREIDAAMGTCPNTRLRACKRAGETFGFERPERMKIYSELTEEDKDRIFNLHQTLKIYSPVGRGSCERTGATLRVEKSAVRKVVNERV